MGLVGAIGVNLAKCILLTVSLPVQKCLIIQNIQRIIC